MTVLLIDDESAIRNVLIRTIAAAGHYVLEAATGAEAILLARSFSGPIHLAVIDQSLEEGRKGVDVAAELADIQPGIRLLLISGTLEEEVLGRLPRTDIALDFLQKPFTARMLLDKIRRMLAHYDRCW